MTRKERECEDSGRHKGPVMLLDKECCSLDVIDPYKPGNDSMKNYITSMDNLLLVMTLHLGVVNSVVTVTVLLLSSGFAVFI